MIIIVDLCRFDTQDGIYDLAWSEIHENQLVSVSGDGSVKLWDVTLDQYPVRKWKEHQREIYSADWNNLRKEVFATASWDQTIKIWAPDRPASISTIHAHAACVYSALFSPHAPDILASCSSDGYLNLWDLRLPSISPPTASILAHSNEVLTLDWNKYIPNIIATGSVDRSIKIHDLRMPNRPTVLAALPGHAYAVRKVAWSPHDPTILASASYDMTVRIWEMNGLTQKMTGMPPDVRARGLHDGHTEFVSGLAWSFFEPGVLASCAWDQEVHVWKAC